MYLFGFSAIILGTVGLLVDISFVIVAILGVSVSLGGLYLSLLSKNTTEFSDISESKKGE